jgi:hypothetical protein
VKDQLGVDARIEPGDTGEFTVWDEDRLLFSKHDVGRFPEHDEILGQLRTG